MKEKKKRNKQQEKSIYQGGWILLATFLLIAGGRYFFHIRFITLPCLMYKCTGYYCPGCGGTRAFLALLNGNFWSSFCYHPVVLYGMVLYVSYMVSHTVEYISKGKIRIGMRYTDWYLYIAFGIILLQWILKNIIKVIWGVELI